MFYAVQQLEHTETLVVGLFQKRPADRQSKGN